MCSPLRVVKVVHLTLVCLFELSMLSFSLMPEKNVSLCFFCFPLFYKIALFVISLFRISIAPAVYF